MTFARIAVTLGLIAAVDCGGSARAPAIQNEAPPPDAAVTLSASEIAWWDDDTREWVGLILKELRATGEQKGYPQLVVLVERTEALVARMDRGELTRPQLVEMFVALEDAMTDPVDDAVQLQLDDVREAMRRANIGVRKDPFGDP